MLLLQALTQHKQVNLAVCLDRTGDFRIEVECKLCPRVQRLYTIVADHGFVFTVTDVDTDWTQCKVAAAIASRVMV